MVPKALCYKDGQMYRPTSAVTRQDGDGKRPQSAKDPMQKVKGRKVEQAFFYTGNKNTVGKSLSLSLQLAALEVRTSKLQEFTLLVREHEVLSVSVSLT